MSPLYEITETEDELLLTARELPRKATPSLLALLLLIWGLLALMGASPTVTIVLLGLLTLIFAVLAVTRRRISITPARIQTDTKPIRLWYNRTVSPYDIHTIRCVKITTLAGRGGTVDQYLVNAETFETAKETTLFAFYNPEDATEFSTRLVGRLNRTRLAPRAPIRLLRADREL
jgi:hypothetical protein